MGRLFSTQTEIIGEAVHDGSGNLIAQQIFKVSTKCGSEGTIHRTIKQIARVRDTNSSGFKEVVCAEAMVVFPDIAESELLIKYLCGGIKECLSIYQQEELNAEIIEEQIRVPVMV